MCHLQNSDPVAAARGVDPAFSPPATLPTEDVGSAQFALTRAGVRALQDFDPEWARVRLATEAPMSPGTYFRLRREASGVAIADLAFRISATGAEHQDSIDAIERLEADAPGNYLALVDRAHRIIRLMPGIYAALVGFAADPESELPCPRICTACGCTWSNACIHAIDEITRGRGAPFTTPCNWRDGPGDRCTGCPPMTGAAETENVQ